MQRVVSELSITADLVGDYVWNLFSLKHSTLFTGPEGKTHKHTTEGKFKH